MKAKWILVAISLLVLFAAVQCDRQAPVASDQPPAAAEPAEPSAAPVAPAPVAQAPDDAVVKALGDLVAVRKKAPVDFNEMSRIYEASLASYVRDADGRYGTELDKEVREALALGLEGNEPAVNAQTAEKSVQRAFLLTFQKSLTALRAGSTAPDEASRFFESLPVVRSVLTRRGEWVGRGSEYVDALDAAVARLRGGMKAGDAGETATATDLIDALLVKGVALSVLYEISGLEATRGDGTDTAAEKRVEARMYHLSLFDTQARRNAQGAEAVREQLDRPVEQIETSLVRGILKGDFQQELADVDPALLGS